MIRTMIFVFIILVGSILFAQSANPEQMRTGINFISTKTFSAKENQALLKQYEKLRVADVSDGMDMAGLPNTGLVDASIQACWKDEKNLSHVFRGIALTVRYVPTQKKDRPEPDEEFTAWEGNFYALAVTEHLGLEDKGGLLRTGLVHYSTASEVDALLGLLEDMPR